MIAVCIDSVLDPKFHCLDSLGASFKSPGRDSSQGHGGLVRQCSTASHLKTDGKTAKDRISHLLWRGSPFE